ncbi:hypothetical protein ABFV99_26770 [Cytobacillus horneckiae]|uniref:YxiG family protein n=1 Tax=Cytobacillus horneckiae TaxID=549687 RepID=UPI0034D007CB
MDKHADRINQFFVEKAEYWGISDLQIDYLSEKIHLKLESVLQQEILKTYITFKEVMSFYVYQEAQIETFRLNDREYNDSSQVSEISYHPNGFGHIKIESLEKDLKEIETISSKTNFYFQVNNKDCFFIEANAISIDDEEFNHLIADSTKLKYPS